MLKRFIAQVVEGINLTQEEAAQAMAAMMSGEALPTQIAALLTALRMKGESSQEITGMAQVMREKAIPITGLKEEIIVDTCGTGGDGRGTFNISTAVAFVAAGGGLTVAKHGNRSVSSQCGSADVLEALGVNLAMSPAKVARALKEIKIAFLFAPLFHPAMKHALAPRREIGIRTIFNLLGPLTNPARATVHLLGLYSPHLLLLICQALKNLGSRAAFVVHGEDGSDEISITGKTTVYHLRNGEISNFQIEPEELGLKRASLKDIQGGSAERNAQIMRAVLRGERGPYREAVLINAAAVFVAAGQAGHLAEGIKIAQEVIDSGQALKKLNELIQFSQTKEE